MKRFVYMFLILSLLSGCNNSNTHAQKNDQVEYLNTHYTIGSDNYIKHIEYIANSVSFNAALNQIMDDVTYHKSEFENDSDLYKEKLDQLISQLIQSIGYINIKVHYFRNELNSCPKTLNDMLIVNSSLPIKRKWKLLPVKGSIYHILGKDGLFNLKFISYNGFCEAVYNKNGQLLTENNDPINMGTFNYAAGMRGSASHKKYDIDPYLKWGNTLSSYMSKAEISSEINKALKNYSENQIVIDEYRKNIIKRFS
ncbi:MAG: hypothetical protein Q8942_12115 [Bacillota bacterium]|nr:hypothetical protein [Bacillota bacterium]